MSTVQKSEWPAGAGQSAKQNTDDATIAPAENIGNAAYLIARLTLAGHVVHKGCDGDFTVCKYAMVKYCKDFAELQAVAVKLGVK